MRLVRISAWLLVLLSVPVAASAEAPPLRLTKIHVDSLRSPQAVTDPVLRKEIHGLRRQLYRQMKAERFEAVRARKSLFAAIAAGNHDKTRERIVYRDQRAVAFLDMT